MTAAQMVAEFGKASRSRTVQNMYDQGVLDKWVTVVHCIEPRADRDMTKRDARNMPWRSVYFEPGSSEGKLLREAGFMSSPRCAHAGPPAAAILRQQPAMEVLGDVQQLQHETAQGRGHRLPDPPADSSTHQREGPRPGYPAGRRKLRRHSQPDGRYPQSAFDEPAPGPCWPIFGMCASGSGAASTPTCS